MSTVLWLVVVPCLLFRLVFLPILSTLPERTRHDRDTDR